MHSLFPMPCLLGSSFNPIYYWLFDNLKLLSWQYISFNLYQIRNAYSIFINANQSGSSGSQAIKFVVLSPSKWLCSHPNYKSIDTFNHNKLNV